MRHLKPKITQRPNNGGTTSFCVDAGIIDGKRHRRFFPTKTAAQEHADQIKDARIKFGNSVFSLDDQQRVEAMHAFEKLKTTESSLTEAVDFFLRHSKPKNGKKLASDLIAEFLETKKTFKPRYLKALRIVYQNFSKAFGTRYVNEISKAEIEGWLSNRTVSAKNLAQVSSLTICNYMRDLGMLFKYAVEEGCCAEKPPIFLNAS